MSQPDLLSEQIEAFRCSFAAYGDTGVTLAPQAIEYLDALFMAFAVQARELESAQETPKARELEAAGLSCRSGDRRSGSGEQLPLDRVVAEIEAETAATEAMTAAIAETNRTLRALRARQDALAAPNVVAFPGVRRRVGDVEVSTALAVLAGLHNDDCAADVSRGAPQADLRPCDTDGGAA